MNAATQESRLTLIDDEPAASQPIVVQQTQSLAVPENSPAGMMLAAMARGASLEQVEKMMDLQERWERREAEKAFVSAMAEFKREPLTIFKRKQVGYTTKEGDFVGYKHAELSDVTEVVGPAMAKHGLSYRWDVKQDAGRINVSCIVTHRLGHSEAVTMDAAPDSSGKKNPIQQIASSVQYLQRYTLLAATGMSTKGMDDDGLGGKDVEDPVLEAFRAASLNGDAALRKHYNDNVPTEEFWATHGKSLKDAAKKADLEHAL